MGTRSISQIKLVGGRSGGVVPSVVENTPPVSAVFDLNNPRTVNSLHRKMVGENSVIYQQIRDIVFHKDLSSGAYLMGEMEQCCTAEQLNRNWNRLKKLSQDKKNRAVYPNGEEVIIELAGYQLAINADKSELLTWEKNMDYGNMYFLLTKGNGKHDELKDGFIYSSLSDFSKSDLNIPDYQYADPQQKKIFELMAYTLLDGSNFGRFLDQLENGGVALLES